ncbi:hypothetical protein D3C84_911820 [compost metagenome]
MELSDKPTFDEGSFDKILVTCSAIANIRKGSKGYVVVGVADNTARALRDRELFGSEPLLFGGFHITGVEHEAKFLGKNLDQLFQMITDRIGRSELSEPLKSYINSHMKCVSYFDKTVFVLEVEGQDQPSLYGNKYFARRGTQVIELGPEDFPTLFSKFR